MRQGCLVCGQWVSSGFGNSLVVSGALTEQVSSGRTLLAENVDGLICSDCRSLDGSVKATKVIQELRDQLALLERTRAELEEMTSEKIRLEEEEQTWKTRVDTLENELQQMRQAPVRIETAGFPVEIVLS